MFGGASRPMLNKAKGYDDKHSPCDKVYTSIDEVKPVSAILVFLE
jgi:hypothetical protein